MHVESPLLPRAWAGKTVWVPVGSGALMLGPPGDALSRARQAAAQAVSPSQQAAQAALLAAGVSTADADVAATAAAAAEEEEEAEAAAAAQPSLAAVEPEAQPDEVGSLAEELTGVGAAAAWELPPQLQSGGEATAPTQPGLASPAAAGGLLRRAPPPRRPSAPAWRPPWAARTCRAGCRRPRRPPATFWAARWGRRTWGWWARRWRRWAQRCMRRRRAGSRLAAQLVAAPQPLSRGGGGGHLQQAPRRRGAETPARAAPGGACVACQLSSSLTG